MIRKLSFLILQIVFVISVQGQDIHFSQFEQTPLFLNPALAGDIMGGNTRIAATYRNQWASLGTPYLTTSLSLDAKLLDTRWKGDYAGAGISIINDHSGDGGLRHFQPMLSGSVRKFLDRKKNHSLAYGIQGGVFQRWIDPSKLTFGNQYEEGNFNSALPSGENFSGYKITRFDLASGFDYRYRNKKGQEFNIGYAISHITQPNQSFLGNSVKMPVLYTLHTSIRIPLKNVFDVEPSFLWLRKKNQNEYVLGGNLFYFFENENNERITLNAGAFFRVDNSAFFSVGANYQNWNVGFSYDINTSVLRTATQNNGAFELSIIYIDNIIPGKNKLVPRVPCQRL